MFNRQSSSRRSRSRDASNGREQREKHFVRLAIFFGFVLAILFGLILYAMNVSKRI
jgi:cell division septal protein FtsQ